MNDVETAVVELIDEGWARWKIAEKLGLGEATVRKVIARLCAEHDCSARELPAKVRKENSVGGASSR